MWARNVFAYRLNSSAVTDFDDERGLQSESFKVVHTCSFVSNVDKIRIITVVHSVAHRMPYAFTPRLAARLIADRQARSRPCS